MNLEAIKHRGIKLGLERELDFQLTYAKSKIEEHTPKANLNALQALHNAVELLSEIISIENEPTTNQSPTDATS